VQILSGPPVCTSLFHQLIVRGFRPLDLHGDDNGLYAPCSEPWRLCGDSVRGMEFQRKTGKLPGGQKPSF
jgi:hypothetical protein